ncbi:MAG: DUF4249 domain-containing protein [Bacteroidetes bacterium]|nr:DUF4249 domain-containing protein [Bacteroidota bacterium]
MKLKIFFSKIMAVESNLQASTSLGFSLLIGTFFILLGGCKKVIDVNLNDASPQIVVEGNIYNTPGPYSIRISKTVNYSADNQFPPVTGASVLVKDITDGTLDTLKESTPGLYLTKKIKGVSGHEYQLLLTTGSQSYTANTLLPQPVPFDSVSFEKLSRPGGKIDWYAVINYQDPVGVSNYYQFSLLVNGRKINNTFAYEDRLSDGKYVSRTLRTDSAYISLGDSVTVIMNHMGKEGYQYYSTYFQVTGNGSLQSISPANPISNISNKALGYFFASATQTRKALAK